MGAGVCGGMAPHVEGPTCCRTSVSSVDTQTDFDTHSTSTHEHDRTHDSSHARRDAAVHSMDTSIVPVLHMLVSHVLGGRRDSEGVLPSGASSLPHIASATDVSAGGDGVKGDVDGDTRVDAHTVSSHLTTHPVGNHIATDSPSGDGVSLPTSSSSNPHGTTEGKVADVSRLLRVPATFARHLTRVVSRELAVLGVDWEASVLPEDTRHGARPAGEVLAHHLLRRCGRGSGRGRGGALSSSAFIFSLEEDGGETPVLRARRRVPPPQVTESTATLRSRQRCGAM